MTLAKGLLSEPPASPEAEGALLGAAMLLTANQAAAALHDIATEHFSTEANRLTYTALIALIKRGESTDPVAVLTELQHTGRVSSWPTPSGSVGCYLHGLVEVVPIPLGYAVARRAVIEASVRRQVHRSALRLAQAAGTASFDGLNRLVACETSSVTAAMKTAVNA